MNPREAFLHRVRQASGQGPPPRTFPLPTRGRTGYQGAGPDPVGRFCQELKAAGGQPHRATSQENAWDIIKDLVQRHAAKNIALSNGGLVDRLNLSSRLRELGLALLPADPTQAGPRSFFTADLGISNVEYLIAETGSLVMSTKPEEPRSVSLLPPIHIALAEKKQLLPDLFDLFDLFSPVGHLAPPSCLTLITGPSKTGDIELKLVTGVHGPGEVHVVLIEE